MGKKWKRPTFTRRISNITAERAKKTAVEKALALKASSSGTTEETAVFARRPYRITTPTN